MKIDTRQTVITGRLSLAAAACISLYLAGMALGDTMLPGCEAGSICQEALRSRWAFAFGIPVSFLGFVTYSIAILWSWAFVRRERTLASLAGGMAISTVIAAAVWFAALQVFALQVLCGWCSLAHGFAVTGAILLWRGRLRHPQPDLDCSLDLRDAGSPLSSDRLFRFTATGSALVAVGMLATGAPAGSPNRRTSPPFQSPPPPAVRQELTSSGLSLPGGETFINPSQFPILGSDSPSARMAILLSDYTCSRCRQYMAALPNIFASSAEPAGAVILPVGKSTTAIEIQRTLLTLFHSDPNAWQAVSALLTSGQISADADTVAAAAEKRLGPEKWAAAVQAHALEVEHQLGLGAVVMQHLSRQGRSEALPQLLCGDRILGGAEQDASRVLTFLRDCGGEQAEQSPAAALTSSAVLESDVIISKLQPGIPAELEIKVRNAGTAPLKFGWVSLDENCEITNLPQQPVPPGASAAIGVRITPPAAGGEFVRVLKIHSNAPDSPGTVTVRCDSGTPVAATN